MKQRTDKLAECKAQERKLVQEGVCSAAEKRKLLVALAQLQVQDAAREVALRCVRREAKELRTALEVSDFGVLYEMLNP